MESNVLTKNQLKVWGMQGEGAGNQPRREESCYVINLQGKKNCLIWTQTEVVPRLYGLRFVHDLGAQGAAKWECGTQGCLTCSERPHWQFPLWEDFSEKGHNVKVSQGCYLMGV